MDQQRENMNTMDDDIENDRKLMRQLIEINNDDKRWAMERSGREDVSRDGDWEHFRNGVYKNKPIKLHAEWEVPREGVLEFDYVHAKTPSRKARGLVQTSSKFNRMCKNLGLHPNCDFKEKPNLNPASILSFFRPKYDLSKLEGKKLDKAACSRIQFWYRKHLKAKRAWEAAQPWNGAHDLQSGVDPRDDRAVLFELLLHLALRRAGVIEGI